MSGQLKEVRERITSVISTQQITKAMKMVSASKLRRAQQAITAMRPYADRLNIILSNILSNLDGDASTTYGTEREINHAAIVVITSSKGLCGAFNSNIIKEANNLAQGKYKELLDDDRLKFVCIGKKGNEYFRKHYGADKVISDYADLFAHLEYEAIRAIAVRLMKDFEEGTFDRIDVCYGKFVNAALQEPMTVQYLPVKKLDKKAGKSNNADYIFEPGKVALLEELVPTILQTTFQKFVLDNHASEHGARMTAMDAATENANELLKELKISYNKARQAAITTELSEIVSGAAALEG